MIKRLTFLLIIILLLTTCNKKNKKLDISGNWYSSSSIKFENNTIDYTEVFIKNGTVYICSEYLLRIFSRKMILENDSLFFFSKTDSNFIGNILNQTEKSFDLGIDLVNRTYYKLESKKNLESLINGEITEKEFNSEFIKRMHNIYERLGIEN